MLKTANSMLILTALVVSACGFDRKQSDPLRDQQGTYVSAAEHALQQQQLEAQFLQETRAYQQSITALEQESQQRTQNLENQYQEIVQQMRGEAQGLQTQCQNELASMANQMTAYRSEQQAVIDSHQQRATQWQEQALACQQIIENPERQNFHGLLFRRELETALPRSLEFSQQESGSHQIFFKLDLAHEALNGIVVEPALPTGLELRRVSDDTWVLEGQAQVGFANGQFQRRSIHRLIPDIDFASIEDEATLTLMQQQNFEERIMVVVYQGEIPAVDGAQNQNEEN